MTLEQTLQLVQAAYPQVYLACHTRHQRKRTSTHRLSARDSTILAHLSEDAPVAPIQLASHLNLARSTVSEALKRLAEMGYIHVVERGATPGDRGGKGVLLTGKGSVAFNETSVLEPARLRAVLKVLSPAELRSVARGMIALAEGCRRNANAAGTS
jgi:DNA-binding MarR family transcriptional regulator